MRFWTVHPIEVWEQIQDNGSVRVDPKRLNPDGYVHPPYQWLASRLTSRVTDSSGNLPWFAYCERPDLRWIRHSRKAGQVNVLIEFFPPPGNAFVFPVWAWNTIFCGKYLAFNRAEQREWNRKMREFNGRTYNTYWGSPFVKLQAELEESWERLFSPKLPRHSWQRDGMSCLEAVVPVIRLNWVKRVQVFVGSGAWMKTSISR